MSPYFRRIVHLHLMKDEYKGLVTESMGEGDYRQVVIKYKEMKVSRLRRAVSAVLSALIISIILPLTAESESWYEDVASNDQYPRRHLVYDHRASYASGGHDIHSNRKTLLLELRP